MPDLLLLRGSGSVWGTGSVPSMAIGRDARLGCGGQAENETFWEGVLFQNDPLGSGIGCFVTTDAYVGAQLSKCGCVSFFISTADEA